MNRIRIALLIAIAPFLSAHAVSQVHAQKKIATRPLTAERRQHLVERVRELELILEECRKGKRDDSEKYVVLRNLLETYGVLGVERSAHKVQAALKEWEDLLSRHPEFKTKPPTETRERRELRERQESEAERFRKLAETFRPIDLGIVRVVQAESKAIVAYQFRVEFYDLPSGVKAVTQRPSSGGGFSLSVEFIKEESGPVHLNPRKTITFKHRIVLVPSRPVPSKGPVWICTNPSAGYSANSPDELRIIQAKGHPSALPWVNDSGEFGDFCGAVQPDGGIVYQLPIRQELPNRILQVRAVTAEGRKALIYIGELIQDPIDGGKTIGNFREFIIWDYPDKIETHDFTDRARAREILERRGFDGPASWLK